MTIFAHGMHVTLRLSGVAYDAEPLEHVTYTACHDSVCCHQHANMFFEIIPCV